MSYINKITVGGEEYNLTPSFDANRVYASDSNGNPIEVYLLSTYQNGDLYPNLSIYSDRIYGLKGYDHAIIPGLGANGLGAVGLYMFTGSGHMDDLFNDNDKFTYGSLARMAMNIDGAIGVCTSGTDGIYVNDFTNCISLKLLTNPVTLESGEQLKLYINPEGFLELVKI